MISPWHRLILAKNQHLITLLRNRGSLNYWLCNHKFPTPMVLHLSSFNTITDYLKACRDLGSETQKMQMLAETMAARFKKGNEGCFTCQDKNHLKRDCPKKANKKNLQKSAPAVIGECIGPEYKSKFDIEGKPISGNSKQGTPQVPFSKNQG